MTATDRQRAIPALYMRGGTSKGVFFLPTDLPADSAARDRVLMRVVGSPDPYEKQIDGMGGATSSTSKVVIVGPSTRPGCDVDYWFGQVAIGQPVIDWSGNCGNLSAAVGPFAIHRGLVRPNGDGIAVVRIWQANLGKRIIAHVPVRGGQVQELGDFELDGVTFPAAEVRLEFLDPGGGDGPEGAMFPTGRAADVLTIPEVGEIRATLVNAGNPTVFVAASSLGLAGTELQPDINNDAELLARAEAIRAHAAVAMGLAPDAAHATAHRQHTPKLAFAAPAAAYTASSGRAVGAGDIDLNVRIFSMGKLHHAMTGTGAVAIAATAAVPGTVLADVLGGPRGELRFGHPSGTLKVGAQARGQDGRWNVALVAMSRTARRLMDGAVLVPPWE
ncbi:2-methylaconitate cis-trans isomerase PrpF [Pigmentiphaga sp.]|uniref:2-methylaconitate cis-trans isomerase PrpF n=1 Tax=Pigmentiphaga sp. TaxID=1977564 RepID=UPI00128DA42F|nr:2-methylaconitate cis-trans isomerase PrpF [Pigmentiphaga sp.]MPS25840.1 2-methylaconitate cis-trans isomerase PrpF [Alcaligenaceae bacterium SAGV5]MPS54523.1 2-methylaconitate cis-trans isomerase PrpF [Alcaligenaceae bacterium SAGV3]MPT58904.1 2-methylaconitate cis-trans isomerase PrpF [Alcaligenaceae bacterium]